MQFYIRYTKCVGSLTLGGVTLPNIGADAEADLSLSLEEGARRNLTCWQARHRLASKQPFDETYTLLSTSGMFQVPFPYIFA